jgi:hypothetical protein
VGIGVSLPLYALDVRSKTDAEGEVIPTIAIYTPSSTAFGGYLANRRVSDNTRQGLIVHGNGSLTLNAGVYNIDFITGAVTAVNDTNLRMRITSAGNVNIGGNYASTTNTLQVTGNVAIGYTTAAPTNGLIVNGNVGIGTATPATSAILDLTSTTGALLLPRMTTTQRDALTAVNGMILYNTTTNTTEARQDGAWVDLSFVIS